MNSISSLLSPSSHPLIYLYSVANLVLPSSAMANIIALIADIENIFPRMLRSRENFQAEPAISRGITIGHIPYIKSRYNKNAILHSSFLSPIENHLKHRLTQWHQMLIFPRLSSRRLRRRTRSNGIGNPTYGSCTSFSSVAVWESKQLQDSTRN